MCADAVLGPSPLAFVWDVGFDEASELVIRIQATQAVRIAGLLGETRYGATDFQVEGLVATDRTCARRLSRGEGAGVVMLRPASAPALALGFALVLAGCIEVDPEPSTVSAGTTDDASPSAGSVDEATASASASAADPPAPRVVQTPVSYAGKTPQGVCAVATGAQTCQFFEQGSETHHAIPLLGKPYSLMGTVTYTSQAPAGSMSAFACALVGEEYQCAPMVRGASPLGLSFDLSTVGNASELIVGLYHTADAGAGLPAAGVVYAAAEFKVEAVLTTTN